MRKIEKALLCGLVIAIVASCASGMSAFAAQCDDIRSSVLRLHILANSDSAQDQALKLKVRDSILSESSELFTAAANKQQAMANAQSKLGKIQEIAQQEVRSQGYTYPVTVRLVHMFFTTRTYGNVTLPAGDYDAIRVSIGAAKGHNWWCVLFPPLCLPSASGDVKLGELLDKDEIAIVQGDQKTSIQVKFKVVEWYEEIVHYFSQK